MYMKKSTAMPNFEVSIRGACEQLDQRVDQQDQ